MKVTPAELRAAYLSTKGKKAQLRGLPPAESDTAKDVAAALKAAVGKYAWLKGTGRKG